MKFALKKKGHVLVSPLKFKEWRKTQFDLRRIAGPVARAKAVQDSTYVGKGERPLGDAGTRKNLRDRKMWTRPSEKAYYGIVNIYEIAGAVEGGGVPSGPGRGRGRGKSSSRQEPPPTPPTPPAATTPSTGAAERVTTRLKRKRGTTSETPGEEIKEKISKKKVPGVGTRFKSEDTALIGTRLEKAGKTVSKYPHWKAASESRHFRDNYEPISRGEEYPDKVLYIWESDTFWRTKPGIAWPSPRKEMRARRIYSPVKRPQVRLEPYIIRRRW